MPRAKTQAVRQTSQQIRRILPKDEPIDISRDQMTMLMMESYKKSSSSAEELMCLREVAKMNGLYEQSAHTQINIMNIEQNTKRLETMSDEDLLKLAGHGAKLFDKVAQIEQKPDEDFVEAEYEEVKNG